MLHHLRCLVPSKTTLLSEIEVRFRKKLQDGNFDAGRNK